MVRRVLLLVLVAIAAVVGINLFDEDLRPEAREIFTRGGAAYARDSGWALMAGFNAPDGRDPRDYAESLRQVAGDQRGRRAAAEGNLDVRAAAEVLCSPENMDCVRAFAQRPESIADLASDNAVLLARYDELLRSHDLRDVSEVLDFYASTGYFSTVMRTQVVRLSQVAAAAGSGKVDAATAWLEPDGAFYRRWLDEAGSILAKMIAVRGLSRDMLVAGQIARTGRTLTPMQWDALERVAAPLTPTQRGVAPVLRVEAWFFSQMLDLMVAQPKATSDVVDSPRVVALALSATVKRNATLNFAQPLYGEWMSLDAVPSDGLDTAIARAQERVREAIQPDWRWVYNYSGKSFTAESPPALGEYVYRVRDLDALAALVRCVIALRRTPVAPEGAGDFVTRSPACRDPYGGSFGWDEKSRTVSFKARAAGQAKRFGGNGDRVTFAPYAG